MSDNPSDLFGSISIDNDHQKKAPPKKKTAPSRTPGKKAVPPKKAVRNRQKKTTGITIRLLCLTLLFTGIYCLCGYLLVPYLIMNRLPDYLADTMLVDVSIAKPAFNPFTFKLSVPSTMVYTNEPGRLPEELLSTASIDMDLDLLPLLRGDLVCSNMNINQLHMKIVRREDKRYNISYLINTRNKENHSEIIDFAELPFLFSLNNIRITDSQIIFDDKKNGKTHLFEDIELALPTLSNFQYQTDNYIQPQFSAVINGSQITLIGETTIAGNDKNEHQTRLSCDLDNIDIPLYFDYLPVSTPVKATKGKANGKLQISFLPGKNKGNKLEIQFTVATTDLTVESKDGRIALDIPSAKFDGSYEPFNKALRIQNILMREPTITDAGSLASTTLSTLAPIIIRPQPEDPLHQFFPSITAKLLIADGGSVIIKKPNQKKPLRIYHSLQLSVRNFSNDTRLPDDQDSTFRLSGEHLTSSASFTWQGQFDKQNRPSGNLQINNMPAAIVAPFLAEKTKDIKGEADLNGLLSINPSRQKKHPFAYELKSAKLTIKDLHLSDQGNEWIHVPHFRCEPVSVINGVSDLGNVYMKNSFATVYRDKVPYLLKSFGVGSGKHIVHGLDYSGTIQIRQSPEKPPLIKFDTVVLQANRLEQKQIKEENFVFSAQVVGGNEIKIKGTLLTAPFKTRSQVAFSKLTPQQVFSWFSNTPILTDSQAVISGKGIFRYPQKEFNGEIEAEDIVIGDTQNPVFRAASARFDTFFWSENSDKLSVEYLLVDQPEFSWTRRGTTTNPINPISVFFRHVFLPEPDTNGHDTDSSLARFSLAINRIDFSNGSISYQDNRLTPPLALGITDVNGSLNTVSYPIVKDDSRFKLNGSIEGSPFTMTGTGKLLQDPPEAEFTFNAPKLPLSLFSQQLSNKTGKIDMSSGSAKVQTFFVHNSTKQTLDATTAITGLTPPSPEAPSALALSMLSNSSGDIVVSSQTATTKEGKPLLTDLLRHFSTSLVKISINPMLIAVEQFGDLVAEQTISFQPGSSDITGQGSERLNRFGEFLASYPFVRLRLTGLVDETTDKRALYEKGIAEEKKRVDEENLKRRKAWQQKNEEEQKKRASLQSQTNGQINETDLPLTEIEPFTPIRPARITVTAKTLTELAKEREQNVYDYFTITLGQSDKRIVIDKKRGAIVRKNGDGNRVEIKLEPLPVQTVSREN